jgi:hypothetical protein
MSFLIEKYAFRKDCCQTTWGNADGKNQTLTFRGPCCSCGEQQVVHTVAADAIKFRDGGFAQDCFPDLPAAEREFLISGICGKCWASMFSPEDEDAGGKD